MNKKVRNLLLSGLSAVICSFNASSQTAMDFQGLDCNGNQVHLFSDLDAGQTVVLFYYMANCGSCPPVAQKIQAMANKINTTFPGTVRGYAFPYNNTTTCTYSSSWVTNNSLPLYTPMDSGAVQVAYYGGFGMPTVVLTGRSSHDVMFSTQNFVAGDTTTMRDLILGMLAENQELSLNSTEAHVFPNPVSGMLNVSFNSGEHADVVFVLSDLQGRKVFEKQSQAVAGENKQEVDVTDLPNGTYLLNALINGKTSTKKVHITH